MKINSKLSLLALGFLTSPVFASAEQCGYHKDAVTIGEGADAVHWPAGSIIPCGPTNVSSVGEMIVRVTNWILGFAGAIAVLFIIWGGIQYLTAAGNEKQVASAKLTLTNAIIGLIVILLAGVIMLLVSNTAGWIATGQPIT